MKDLTFGVLDLCFILPVLAEINIPCLWYIILKYHKTVNKVIFASSFCRLFYEPDKCSLLY